MFTELIYWFVRVSAYYRDRIGAWNEANSVVLDDKQLHFLVIGIIGLLMVFAIYPLFKFLAKRNHTMVITWIYVFTCMLVLTFAIEIGQGYSGTGRVEMADVVYGLGGFMAMFFIFAVIRGIYHLIRNYFRHKEA